MAVDKQWSLDKAIEIAKEYARGGGQYNPDVYLKSAYETLNKLQEDLAE